MLNYKKFLYLIALILTGFLFFYSLSIDWSIHWSAPLAVAILILLILSSAENSQRLFLCLLAIFPTVLLFHDYKMNLSAIFPSLENYNLPINLTAILSLFYIFFGLLAVLANRTAIKKMPLRIILPFYAFFILLSLLWTDNLSASLSGAVYLLAPLAAYFIAYNFFGGRQNFLKLIAAIIISSAAPVLIAFYQIITGQYFYEPDSFLPRVAGPFTHPNLFGLYLFVILTVMVIFFMSKKKKTFKTNWLIIVWAIVLSAVLILTYSRVSWAALAMALIIIGLIRPMMLGLLAAASPIFILLAFSFETIRSRIMEISSNAIYNSLIARKNIWQVAYKEIIKNPYVGYGIGTAESVIAKAKFWSGGTSLPHNDYLQYTLELGVAGVFLFLWLIGSAIGYCLKFWSNEPDTCQSVNIFNKTIEINFKIFYFGAAAILISMLLASFFESTSREIAAQIIIWSLLGGLFGLKKN